MAEIPPMELAMLAPRLRALAVKLSRTPSQSERTRIFRAWCAAQPDGYEILKQVAEVDPLGPPPPYGVG